MDKITEKAISDFKSGFVHKGGYLDLFAHGTGELYRSGLDSHPFWWDNDCDKLVEYAEMLDRVGFIVVDITKNKGVIKCTYSFSKGDAIQMAAEFAKVVDDEYRKKNNARYGYSFQRIDIKVSYPNVRFRFW